MTVSRVPTDPDMKRELRKFLDEVERRIRKLETDKIALEARVTALESA